MDNDFSKIEKELENQSNRLIAIEEDYLKNKDKVHSIQLQLEKDTVSTEESIILIKDEVKKLHEDLLFLKKVTINAIKRLKQTTKVEEFNRLKRTIEEIDLKNKVTRRNINKIIEEGFESN